MLNVHSLLWLISRGYQNITIYEGGTPTPCQAVHARFGTLWWRGAGASDGVMICDGFVTVTVQEYVVYFNIIQHSHEIIRLWEIASL